MGTNKDLEYDINYIAEKNQNPGEDQPRVVERNNDIEKNADQNLLSNQSDIDSRLDHSLNQ
jgi:hypothetical protein